VKLTGTNRSFDLIALVAKATLSVQSVKNALNEPRVSAGGLRPCGPSDRGPSAKSKPKSQFCFKNPFFAGLVALARRSDPIPSRTRPSNAFAPMVLCLKTWESRSSPGLQRTDNGYQQRRTDRPASQGFKRFLFLLKRKGPHDRDVPSSAVRLRPPIAAGWSSPVARQAHNLKAAGSNPAPATTES
jgi:hypothetical protein